MGQGGLMGAKTSDSSGIGARLRASRERLSWTREALAFHSGISWSAIAQVETGRRTNVRPRTLSALSGALGVTIDYLVNGTLAPTPMFEHSAYFYGDDGKYRATIGSFLAAGLERSEAALAVTTAGNIELLREHLAKDARSVKFVDSTSWLTTPQAALEAFGSFSDTKLRAGDRLGSESSPSRSGRPGPSPRCGSGHDSSRSSTSCSGRRPCRWSVRYDSAQPPPRS